ncbi:MAG: hypothetical protein OHK0046_04190 [Anaerolineae bacterium]
MNPLVNGWLRLWDGLTQHYRYQPPAWHNALEWPTQHAVYELRGTLSHEQALDILQANSIKGHFRYRHFTKAKKSGGVRHLDEPDAALKAIQHQIYHIFLKTHPPHLAAVGFQRKRSVADHVWKHAGARIIIAADIEDFFPSTRLSRVERWWNDTLNHEQSARLFTLLTTYKGVLPQGAPTSPALSNLLNTQLDAKLWHLAMDTGGTYTRYCDDLLFSWPSNPPADIHNRVRGLLHDVGYRLHPEKGWRVYTQRDEPEITGAVLNRRGTVSIPEWMVSRMKELARSDDPYDKARLAGYESYRRMIERES